MKSLHYPCGTIISHPGSDHNMHAPTSKCKHVEITFAMTNLQLLLSYATPCTQGVPDTRLVNDL